jgi:hypothetical protein
MFRIFKLGLFESKSFLKFEYYSRLTSLDPIATVVLFSFCLYYCKERDGALLYPE